jgi:HK97 family phage major capsid protein
MKIKISTAQALAVQRHSIDLLQSLKVKSMQDFDPEVLSWRALNDAEAACKRFGSALADSMTNDKTADQLKVLEDASNAIISTLDAIAGTKDERNALGVREPAEMARMKNRPDPRRPLLGREGRGIDDGQRGDEDPDEEGFALRPEQRMTAWARARTEEQFPGLTLGRYLRSMITGASNDLERRALAAGTDSSGGFTTPDVLSGELIDMLRAKSVLSAAGARTIPLRSDRNNIAAVASDPVPGWRTENAAVAESDPSFRNVALIPRTLAVLTKVPVELLEDSLNIDTALPSLMASALAAELDRVGLMGTGVAPQPLGVNGVAGIGSTALSASLASYAPLITARTALLTANSDLTAYIMHPRDEGKLAGLVDSTGQPIMPPDAIARVRKLTTTAIPTNLGGGTNESIIFAGNWDDLLIGIRSDIRIEILKELYMGNLQYGFVAWLRADFAVRTPTSFHKTTAVRP